MAAHGAGRGAQHQGPALLHTALSFCAACYHIETLDPVPQVKWRRVVLDEAHSIKDRRCSTARSVFALDARYKWALSGTPLQAREPLRIL